LAPAERSAFVDLLRSASVVSIIWLHITFLNLARAPAAPSNAWYYKIATVLGSVYSNETLIFVSLLLALTKLDGHNFPAFLAARLARIGIPFLGFTIFYVALDAIGQQQGVLFKYNLGEAMTLLLVAGLGEYHLHFLPALLLLIFITPVFARCMSLGKIFVLLLVGALVRFLTEYLVISDASAAGFTAGQLLLLHFGKVAAYLPFGFLAGWFVVRMPEIETWHGRRSLPTLFLLIGGAAVTLWIAQWPALGGEGRLAPSVMVRELLGVALSVVGIFLVAAWSPAFSRKDHWDAVYSEFYSRAFLILMIHPLFLQIFTMFAAPRPASPVYDLLCLGFVLSASFVVAGAAKRIIDRMRAEARP
jgi:Acyltransferase family